jgi:hypothetical protein
LSGWQDSNLRPPAPKAGAITGLRYTPNWLSVYINFIYIYFQFSKNCKNLCRIQPASFTLKASRDNRATSCHALA